MQNPYRTPTDPPGNSSWCVSGVVAAPPWQPPHAREDNEIVDNDLRPLPEYEPPAHPHTGDHCFGCGEPVRGPLDGTTMRVDGALRVLHMRCARERMKR